LRSVKASDSLSASETALVSAWVSGSAMRSESVKASD
jgi:hypothetical protein